jgi:hypothetical protein
MASRPSTNAFRRGLLVAGIVGIAALSRTDGAVYCQFGGCVNTASGVTNPPQLNPIIESLDGCTADGVAASSTLQDGAWVRAGKYVTVGASASTSGQCNKFGWHPYPTKCDPMGTELRTILNVDTYEILPSGAQNPSQFQHLKLTNQFGGGTVYLQSIDSSVPGSTNGPFLFWLTAEGVHDFRESVATAPTACSIQPTNHSESHRPVNVMECKPEWFTRQDSQGNPIPGSANYHAPPGPITIIIPAGFEAAEAAARAAAAAWAAALNIVINVNMGGTCSIGSGTCVTMSGDHGTLPTDIGCASFRGAGSTSDGTWNDTGTIRLMSTWQDAHPNRLQHTIAHELGHYFGLWNRVDPSCAGPSTIMNGGAGAPGGGCNSSSVPDPAYPLGPTAADIAALKNGTYGQHNRTICGW